MKKEKLPFDIVMRETDRFKTEIAWLDTKFFVPVDNFMIDDERPVSKLSLEEFKQTMHVAQNYDVIEMLQDYDKQSGKSIFKYISYLDMLAVYVNGDKKKEEILMGEIEASNDGVCIHNEFAAFSDEFAKHRNAYLKMLEDENEVKRMQDETIALE